MGRLLYGFGTGLLIVTWPRYMEEVVPSSLVSVYGGLYCFSFAIATIIAYLLAIGLPDDTDTVELEKSEFWRVIFGLPILFFVTQLIFMRTYMKYDSPKVLLLKQQNA